jgi:hypothetical protein
MTRFAEPDIIACPHCGQRFYRRVLCSFNSIWEQHYSDGGTSNGLSNMIIRESRCTQCQKIVQGVEELIAIKVEQTKVSWFKWWLKAESIEYLPAATFDVYVELFNSTTEINQKRQWAVKAYRIFNQQYKLQGSETEASIEVQNDYFVVTNFILENPISPMLDEYVLMCADIHRLCGQPVLSKQTYDTVVEQRFNYIVEQGKRWCDEHNTSLMAIIHPESAN